MAWNKQKIEGILFDKLKFFFSESPSEADKFFGYYTIARDTLLSENIFNDIKIIQPGLSDHGENHIMEVLSNANKLLGHKITDIDAMQIYFICVLILFHDVGNLTVDRSIHHQQDVIREVYDYIRHQSIEFDEERILIPEVASKHSGNASDGSKDTINELSHLPQHLFTTPIHSRKCAALLRFADELAEGPQRTSIFMNKYYNYPYDINSIIYHKYAEITKINIDRDNERICITYNFKIHAIEGIIAEEEHLNFLELFGFTIKRMLKLENERKYCKYYCDWLEPYKKTHIIFNFIIENNIDGKLKSKRIISDFSEIYLNDLVIPGQNSADKFYEENIEFEPEKVFNTIKNAL